jgi:hypothetical protein
VPSAIRFAFGLGWELVTYKGRISRRSCFPSWSWLGWKCDGSDTNIRFQEDGKWEHYIQVSIEIGGAVIPWESISKHARDEFDSDRIPVVLRVRGFVFDLKPSFWMGKPKCRFSTPSGSPIREFSGLQAYAKAWEAECSNEPIDGRKMIGLIIGVWNAGVGYGGYCYSRVMILHYSETHRAYERYPVLIRMDWKLEDLNKAFWPLKCKSQEIRIR